jgi:hypothetical protein
MKYSKHYASILSLILFSLTSCHNGAEEKKAGSDNSLKIENASFNKLSGLFKKELSLPFIVDSAFLANGHFGDSLGTNEIQMLTENSFKSDNGMGYQLSEFYKIDSVKATGTYAKWCEKLDIGMTKYANAYGIGKINVNGTLFLVWAFTQSSYEACPWSSGTSVYLTTVNTNSMGESFLLGETYGAGDAPVSMHRETFAKLNPDGKIFQATEEENDDADATESELTVSDAERIVKDGKIELIKENKGQTIKVPHPPVSE